MSICVAFGFEEAAHAYTVLAIRKEAALDIGRVVGACTSHGLLAVAPFTPFRCLAGAGNLWCKHFRYSVRFTLVHSAEPFRFIVCIQTADLARWQDKNRDSLTLLALHRLPMAPRTGVVKSGSRTRNNCMAAKSLILSRCGCL